MTSPPTPERPCRRRRAIPTPPPAPAVRGAGRRRRPSGPTVASSGTVTAGAKASPRVSSVSKRRRSPARRRQVIGDVGALAGGPADVPAVQDELGQVDVGDERQPGPGRTAARRWRRGRRPPTRRGGRPRRRPNRSAGEHPSSPSGGVAAEGDGEALDRLRPGGRGARRGRSRRTASGAGGRRGRRRRHRNGIGVGGGEPIGGPRPRRGQAVEDDRRGSVVAGAVMHKKVKSKQSIVKC